MVAVGNYSSHYSRGIDARAAEDVSGAMGEKGEKPSAPVATVSPW